MCGKAAVSGLSWMDVYAFADVFSAPSNLPPDPEMRVNVSPSRLRRKSEPDSMVWETLPVVFSDDGLDRPADAIWPFLPVYSDGRLPMNRQGRLISTANERLRPTGTPFAPTFMGAWRGGMRVVVLVSWFYEFDSRVRPQVPYAVFPLDMPFWMMAGLARWTTLADGSKHLTVAIITVDPNNVLQSVGHNRSPALLQSPEEARDWMRGERSEARTLLRPYPDDSMGVEPVPMGIKIPGNQDIDLPDALSRR